MTSEREHAEVGTGTAVYEEPFGGLPKAARRRPRILRNGQDARPVETRVVVGTASTADIKIDDEAVSRVHCALEPREDGLWVFDLDSRNGTYVNDVRVSGARVAPIDRIRVGQTVLRVDYEVDPTEVALWPLDRFGALVGQSIAMRELFARMHRVAGTDTSVLLQGESGTGKELAARAIHAMSARHEEPFVVVDCGAIPETLLEAELFGASKGAYTGADTNRMGMIEAANGGTLLFDEIGELPLRLQPKLLRFLESRTIRRVGEHDQRSVDARIIAATHRDLGSMVNDGAFREDLYFRLAVVPLTLPPLRHRLDDLPALLQHFLPTQAPPPEDLVAKLRARPWYGNVRELRNFVERMQVLGVDEALDVVRPGSQVRREGDFPPVALDVPFKELRDQWVSHLERDYIGRLLEQYDGNISAAAKAAGIDRTYVHRLVNKHGL